MKRGFIPSCLPKRLGRFVPGHCQGLTLLQILFFLLPCGISAGDSPEFIRMIRTSQDLLAQGEPQQAAAPLIQWEKVHPDANKNPTFCYQFFFVALEGTGDRATARRMLNCLTRLVENGTLKEDSSIYLAVTEAWYRALFFADSDLPRLAHKKMKQRLDLQNP